MIKITSQLILSVFFAWCILVYVIFAGVALIGGDVKMRAMAGMVSGLLLLWVVIGGTLMYAGRDRVKELISKIPLDWRIKFILFATVLALAEEAVTTGMTNLAPLFGVRLGEVAITASADYIEVVTRHSVIVFIPMFIAWALILSRYKFSPGSVMILWGLTGTLAETISFGMQNLLDAGFWVFVYGLMVYLPAYAVPEGRKASAPKAYHYPLAILAPILFLIPVYFIVAIVLSITHL
jgi:hypothetical protein